MKRSEQSRAAFCADLAADLLDWTYSWLRYWVYVTLPWSIAQNLKNPFVLWALEGAGIGYVHGWAEYRWLRQGLRRRRDPVFGQEDEEIPF